MFNFIKTHKLISVVFVLIVLGIIGYLILKTSSEQTQINIPSYGSTTPGISTKEQVIEKLGNPIETKTQGTNELLTFKSDKTERPDEYYFQNGLNKLVKEIVPYNDPRKIEELRTKYGNANLVLYGEGSIGGFYLFAYTDKGVAYIGNPTSGNLLEIWYFTPVSESEFINSWAQGYSKTQPSPHGDNILDF